MIRNLIFDVGDVLVEYRWFEMLTRDYGLSEAEAKRIGEECLTMRSGYRDLTEEG